MLPTEDPDQWTGPGNDLPARFGRDAATPNGSTASGWRSRPTSARGSCAPGASCPPQREVAVDLLEAGPRATCWADKGFNGKAFAAELAALGTGVRVRPRKDQRATMPAMLLKVIAEWRNRVETVFAEITGQMELAQTRRPYLLGLLTRTTATIVAHTIMRACLTGA